MTLMLVTHRFQFAGALSSKKKTRGTWEIMFYFCERDYDINTRQIMSQQGSFTTFFTSFLKS